MYLNLTGLTSPRFSGQRFPGEFPPHGGLVSDYPGGDYGESGFGGYDSSDRQDYLDSGMDRRPFSDSMGHHPGGIGDGYGSGGGRDGYGRSGLLGNNPGSLYPDEYRGGQMGSGLMNRAMEKPPERPGLMGAAPEGGPNTLLTYLVRLTSHNKFLPNLIIIKVILLNYSEYL